MLYLNYSIHIVAFLYRGRLRKVNFKAIINTASVKPDVYSVFSIRAAWNIA